MADYTSDRTGANIDLQLDNADTQLTPTIGSALLHAGNSGTLRFGDNGAQVGSTEVVIANTTGRISMANIGTSLATVAFFVNDNAQVGSITTSGTVTAFVTSSDPRLKDFKDAPADAEIDTKFNKLFGCFKVFNFKKDPTGDLIWGFDAHACIDYGLDMGSEGEGPRDLSLGDIYNVIPEVTEQKDLQVTYKTGDKKGELRFNADGSPMMETVDVVVKPEIEQKVSPAGVDQSKAVPILLAKIEQLERRLVAAGI